MKEMKKSDSLKFLTLAHFRQKFQQNAILLDILMTKLWITHRRVKIEGFMWKILVNKRTFSVLFDNSRAIGFINQYRVVFF